MTYQILLDCSINFEYGKPLLPNAMIAGVLVDMQRMHSWYTRACRLGLTSMWTRYDPDIFRAKDIGVTDIMFDFEDN
jgi:hypothetical protein